MIDNDESFTLVDSRPAHKFEAWRLPDAVSFPFGARESLDEAQLATFRDIAAPDEPVVTVCGKGVRCVHLAVELAGAGYEHLKTVSDGMWGYLDLYETATATLDEDYRVVQFQRRGKGCLSYLVGSQRTGEAVVIDECLGAVPLCSLGTMGAPFSAYHQYAVVQRGVDCHTGFLGVGVYRFCAYQWSVALICPAV